MATHWQDFDEHDLYINTGFDTTHKGRGRSAVRRYSSAIGVEALGAKAPPGQKA
jgi:hypothetical protein